MNLENDGLQFVRDFFAMFAALAIAGLAIFLCALLVGGVGHVLEAYVGGWASSAWFGLCYLGFCAFMLAAAANLVD